MPPEAVFANIEATVDLLEARGITRCNCLLRAVDWARLFADGPEAISARPEPSSEGPFGHCFAHLRIV
jgi:hypothetical protein